MNIINKQFIINTERYGDSNEVNYKQIFEDCILFSELNDLINKRRQQLYKKNSSNNFDKNQRHNELLNLQTFIRKLQRKRLAEGKQ